jgi:hypothetical protein
MGLALHDKIGVGASASVDDVLGSDSKPPRLRHFLLHKRFVIVADDADTEGCSELLLHVPQSTQPCALVLTSQYGSDIIRQLEGSQRSGDLVRIQLQCFEPEVSMQLVDSVCSHDDYALSRGSLLAWLSQVLKELGQLPLAVRLFAEWLHQELAQAALQKIAVDVADLQARWAHEYANDVDEAAGVLGSVIGSRGLRATVRLALHNLQKLKSSEENEACRQLLGLLALCPPVQVPWSLFDGGFTQVPGVVKNQKSADQPAALSFARGAHVDVDGSSLEYVSPVGLHCQVRGDKSGVNPGIIHGVNGSEIVVERHQKSERVQYGRVIVEQGDLEMKDGRCMLRLGMYQPVAGSPCSSSKGVTGIITCSVVHDDPSTFDSRRQVVVLTPDSLFFADVWLQYISRRFMSCSRDLFFAVFMTSFHTYFGWSYRILGFVFVMLHFTLELFAAFSLVSYFPVRLLLAFVPGASRLNAGDALSVFWHMLHVVTALLSRSQRLPKFAISVAYLAVALASPVVSVFHLELNLRIAPLAAALYFCFIPVLGDWPSVSATFALKMAHADVNFIVMAVAFLVLNIFKHHRLVHEYKARVSAITIPGSDNISVHNGHLCSKRRAPPKHYRCSGRVLQRHEDDTVSVAFGCESGACLLRAPRARICCVHDA